MTEYWGDGKWREREVARMRYVKEPSNIQVGWGACGDPRGVLTIGAVYDCEIEAHTWHTKIFVKGHERGFNSLSFEPAPPAESTNEGGDDGD